MIGELILAPSFNIIYTKLTTSSRETPGHAVYWGVVTAGAAGRTAAAEFVRMVAAQVDLVTVVAVRTAAAEIVRMVAAAVAARAGLVTVAVVRTAEFARKGAAETDHMVAEPVAAQIGRMTVAVVRTIAAAVARTAEVAHMEADHIEAARTVAGRMAAVAHTAGKAARKALAP